LPALGLGVEAARRAEIGEPEFDAGIPEAVTQYVEGAAPLDLEREPLQELFFHRGTVVLGEPPPLLGLGGEHEIRRVARDQAQRPVVVFGQPPSVAARRHFAPWRLRRLSNADDSLLAGVRPIAQEPAFDRIFEGAF
jgi:hypothetical protein